jgi:ParB family transcriptional regulator, chromosome partitioning protein
MSENPARRDEPRISRLDLVRSGGGESGLLKIPKRGRVMVDVESVVPDPKNERKVFRRIPELAATIKAVGIIDPPTVVPLEDGRYKITTGERRWRAAKEAGLKQIPVIIGDGEHERMRRAKSLISNIQREDLSALELAQGIQDMKDDNPDVKTNREVAGRIGKSEQWVGQMLKILKLPEAAQEKIRSAERVIPYDSVIEIARLEDIKAQSELLKSVLAGATVREIRERVRESKPGRAGKPRARSTQKIRIAKGWVIVHCENKTAKKEDILAALTEAVKVVQKLPTSVV